MNLSKEALTKLRLILEKELGPKAKEFSDEVIASIGMRYLKNPVFKDVRPDLLAAWFYVGTIMQQTWIKENT